jgi:deoxyribodipyrimidine photo-lyase
MAAIKTFLWVRNDLRLIDNYAMHKAIEVARREGASGEVIPVVCLDPRSWNPSKLEEKLDVSPMGPARAKFLVEAIQDMKQGLMNLGSDCLVAQCQPEELFAALCSAGDVLVAQDETALRERAVQEAVAKALADKGCRIEFVWGTTLYHRCKNVRFLLLLLYASGTD